MVFEHLIPCSSSASGGRDMTVCVRESSRRAGAAQVVAPVPEAPPAKAPASTEQVSISLPDLLEELKNHVGTDKQEGLQQLKQRAAEHPEEQVKLKRDILNLTGAEALRAAVTALMNKPKPPPPELLIPSLWAEGMSKEDFKAALVHSFHCRTPSCPVPDCASITSKLQRLHQAPGPVAMVGDGLNDAPALAAADLGIAVGTGTQIAQDSADLVVLGERLMAVPQALALARSAQAKIRQNLSWAFGYNLLVLPLAAGVLLPGFGLLLTPPLAALLMALSSITVVANALLLRAPA